ncbi:hypothetical protein CRYUN_Cryun12cG0073600 [Craigia yunnanensis]
MLMIMGLRYLYYFFLVLEMSGRFSRTIYVGNLPSDIKEWEVEDLFYKAALYLILMNYGRILDIELKIPPRPPCYCFVEFENSRDAEDAIRGRDGYNFDGCRLRDHMRKAGDVCFAEISRDSDGTFGIVDYTNDDDMKYAICKLDDTEFRNPWARAYIQVKRYESSPSRSQSRSHSRSRSVRRERSKSWERSASKSPIKSRSASSVKSSRARSRSRPRSGLPDKLLEKVNIDDLITNVGSGGGAAPVAVSASYGAGSVGAAAAAPAIEEKKVEEKEESDDDMGFSLFH